MNLILKPEGLKMHTKITNINQYFEASKETKFASLYEITLIDIESELTVTSEGYNKVEVMAECLEKLNRLVSAYSFCNNVYEENTTLDIYEVDTVVK